MKPLERTGFLMAKLQKRIFGMALTAGIVGVGCSTYPMMAPVQDGGGGAAATTAALSPIEEALSRADAYFITQYHHRRYNPNQLRGNNANCGPTSLAMALRAFRKEPANLEGAENSYQLIRTVRAAMTGKVDEHAWTYPVQVRDGARKLGLYSDLVFGVEQLRDVMRKSGRMVVVNVNPTPAYADKLAVPYDGGHFALVTAIHGDRVFLSDPLAPGPIVITLAQLDTALTTPIGKDPYGNHVAAYNGGIVLWQ